MKLSAASNHGFNAIQLPYVNGLFLSSPSAATSAISHNHECMFVVSGRDFGCCEHKVLL
jgi:hypothetical protein